MLGNSRAVKNILESLYQEVSGKSDVELQRDLEQHQPSDVAEILFNANLSSVNQRNSITYYNYSNVVMEFISKKISDSRLHTIDIDEINRLYNHVNHINLFTVADVSKQESWSLLNNSELTQRGSCKSSIFGKYNMIVDEDYEWAMAA